MKKFIISFGGNHLKDFKVCPLKVALVIIARDEQEARAKVFNHPLIKDKFCTSYPYESYIESFREYGMQEYSLDELNNLRKS